MAALVSMIRGLMLTLLYRELNEMQTVYGIQPITESAREWIDDNVQSESWQWLGQTLVIDHRFIEDVFNGMVDYGLINDKDFMIIN